MRIRKIVFQYCSIITETRQSIIRKEKERGVRARARTKFIYVLYLEPIFKHVQCMHIN